MMTRRSILSALVGAVALPLVASKRALASRASQNGITTLDASSFSVGDNVIINGRSCAIAGIDGNSITVEDNIIIHSQGPAATISCVLRNQTIVLQGVFRYCRFINCHFIGGPGTLILEGCSFESCTGSGELPVGAIVKECTFDRCEMPSISSDSTVKHNIFCKSPFSFCVAPGAKRVLFTSNYIC